MNGKNALSSAPLLNPGHGVGCEPVMGMDDIKGTDKILGLKEMINHGSTHIVDLLDKVIIQLKGTTVIMNPVDEFIICLSLSHASKDMDIMPLSL